MPKRGRSKTGKTSAAKRRQTGLVRLATALGVPQSSIAPGRIRTGGSYGRYAGRNAELKYFDTAINFNIDNTGEVPATGQLCLIPQGVTENTRVGRKCVIKSIQGRLDISLTPGAGASPMSGSWAIYVILDKQTNGAPAAVSDVFNGTILTQAMHNLSNSQRFVVLKKFVRTIEPKAGVSTAYNGEVQHLEFYKRCNLPLEFSSTTGAITELRSNNIFLMAGSYPAGVDDLIGCSGVIRLRFSDGS